MSITAPAPRVLADAIPRSFARDAILVVAAASFVGLSAQIILPIPNSPVPITGQTFGVLLAGAALGPLRGVLSMLLYSIVGLAGVPWFAGAESGYTTATFGYIIGFVLAAGLVGWLAERGWTRSAIDTALAMVLGNVLIYVIGASWLKMALDLSWGSAVAAGMTPFLLGDALKIAFAAGLFPLVWKQLERGGFVSRSSDAEATTESPTTESPATVDLTAVDLTEDSVDITDATLARREAEDATTITVTKADMIDLREDVDELVNETTGDTEH